MYVVKKRSIIICGVLTVLFLLAIVLTACCFSSTQVLSSSGSRVRVVIDAGHGGVDAGAVGSFLKVKESEINLSVSKMLKERFEASNIDVIMTRSDSNGLYGTAAPGFKKRDMQKRKQIIEQAAPNMVISVHMNKSDLQSCSGAQVFYYKDSANSKQLADCIQNSLNGNISFARKRQIASADFFILNCSQYTSVLVECGFLSNAKEESLLSSTAYQEKIAQYIYEGAINYLTMEIQ